MEDANNLMLACVIASVTARCALHKLTQGAAESSGSPSRPLTSLRSPADRPPLCRSSIFEFRRGKPRVYLMAEGRAADPLMMGVRNCASVLRSAELLDGSTTVGACACYNPNWAAILPIPSLQGEGGHSWRGAAAGQTSSSGCTSPAASHAQRRTSHQRRRIVQLSPAAGQPGRLHQGHEGPAGEREASGDRTP